MKICACCKEEKPYLDFHKKKKSKDGYHSYCRICTAKKNKEWVQNNKEQQALSCKNWYSKNKEKANLSGTNWHYKTNYGISYQQFLDLATKQGNICLICKRDLTFLEKKDSRAVLDHCHTTGKIRGVLCNSCNTALGKFKDSIDILQNAISYLKDSKN